MENSSDCNESFFLLFSFFFAFCFTIYWSYAIFSTDETEQLFVANCLCFSSLGRCLLYLISFYLFSWNFYVFFFLLLFFSCWSFHSNWVEFILCCFFSSFHLTGSELFCVYLGKKIANLMQWRRRMFVRFDVCSDFNLFSFQVRSFLKNFKNKQISIERERQEKKILKCIWRKIQ